MVTTPEAELLRKKAGQYLKGLRKDIGIYQNVLGERLGLEFFTFVSQVERGACQMPPYLVKKWADALGVDQKNIPINIKKYYHPDYHEMIFLSKTRRKPS